MAFIFGDKVICKIKEVFLKALFLSLTVNLRFDASCFSRSFSLDGWGSWGTSIRNSILSRVLFHWIYCRVASRGRESSSSSLSKSLREEKGSSSSTIKRCMEQNVISPSILSPFKLHPSFTSRGCQCLIPFSLSYNKSLLLPLTFAS